jgi:hypothetical protein
MCLQFEITDDEVEEIRVGFVKWVNDYKEWEDFLKKNTNLTHHQIIYSIYYQHDPSRISACLITIQALLHIMDSIKAVSPVWCYWAFPMERYCGALQPAIRSHCFPYISLDHYVVEDTQLAQIKTVYNITGELSLQPARGAIAGSYSTPLCMLYVYSMLVP